MIPAQARIAMAIGVASLLVLLGWTVNGWRLNNAHIKERQTWQDAADEKLRAATADRDALAARLKESDDAHLAALEKAHAENTALRNRVDTGRVGLRVAAKCPAVVHMPQAASDPGVDPGAGAELDADARSDYFALREGLRRFESKLSACQAQLRGRQ